MSSGNESDDRDTVEGLRQASKTVECMAAEIDRLESENEDLKSKNEDLESRRGFGKKLLSTVGAVGFGGLVWQTYRNVSEPEMYRQQEVMGQEPAEYDLDVDEGQDFLNNLLEEERYPNDVVSTARDDIGRGSVSAGFLDEQNRIDFYDEAVESSLKMSDDLYTDAKIAATDVIVT